MTDLEQFDGSWPDTHTVSRAFSVYLPKISATIPAWLLKTNTDCIIKRLPLLALFSLSSQNNLSSSPDCRYPTTTPAFSVPKLSTNFLLGFAIVVLSGIALFLVAQRYRGLLIAGTVNKTPITRWELNKVLTNRYGDAVLEELVNNELLTQEAAKQGITITDEDLANERQSLVDSLGGEENLASALTQYGLSEADLSDQLLS